MADDKKKSVAEILAAARKKDGSGDAPAPAANAPAPAAATPPATPVESSATPAKIAKPGSSERPNIKDILAMARSGPGTPAAGEKPAAAEKPAAGEKPDAGEKPAASAKPAPVKAAAKPAAGGAKPAPAARDTASILAAAGGKKDKPGPMSKSEAAAKATTATATAGKPKLTVPPMPTRPSYAQKPDAGPASTKAGASKAGSKAAKGKAAGASAADSDRRSFLYIGFAAVGAVTALWSAAAVKFMFPNVLREPPSRFKVGFPDAFPVGSVDERFKAQFGIWVVSTEYNGRQELVALRTVCTHLGCTPNWLESEQKFKCPCHGSGFYKDGINFEGPAPRPLERYAIRLADDGQVEVDKSKMFQEEMGQWSDPSSHIPV